MAKKIYTVFASCIALILTLAFVEPPRASAIEGGQHGDRRAHSRRHRPARKKPLRRRAAAYVCPMHPDMRSNSPGTCAKCLMELVRMDASPAQAQVKK